MTAAFLANMAWASLFMLVVLLIRRPAARLFGAGPAYALWLLPVLRLIAPPLPSLAPDIAPDLPPLALIVSVAEEAAPLPPDGGPGQWVPLLLAIWAGGAAVFLVWQFFSYRRFLTELSLTSRSLGAWRGLPLVESSAVQGPLALGLLDRRIVVPEDFATRYTPGEQRLALDHEAIHHRRGDLWCNHLGLFILSLNWFNPLAWIAFRAFRADQELACDAAVAGAASAEARHDYARALIKSASRPGLIAACPLNHADQLKRRLRMMKDHKASRPRLFGGAAAVTLLAGAGLALGTPGLAQQGDPEPETKQPNADRRDEHRDHREHVIIRTHRTGDGERREHDGDREHSTHRDGERDRQVIIMRRPGGPGGPGAHREHGGEDGPGHRIERFELRRGPGEHHATAIAHCGGDGERTEINEGDDRERTRIVLCSRGDRSPAQRLEALQRARGELAEDDHLSAEQRARITAALDREIARLRAQ